MVEYQVNRIIKNLGEMKIGRKSRFELQYHANYDTNHTDVNFAWKLVESAADETEKW